MSWRAPAQLPVTGEHPRGAVVHADREPHGALALGRLQHRAQLRLEPEVVGGAVELVERGCLLGPTARRGFGAHRGHPVLLWWWAPATLRVPIRRSAPLRGLLKCSARA
jgi:hypothetical protein